MSQKLEIQLSDRCFEALICHCEQNSQSPSTLIEQLLSQTFDFVPSLTNSKETNSNDGLEADSNHFPQAQQLKQLEERLTQLIYQTIDIRLEQARLAQTQVNQSELVTAIANNPISLPQKKLAEELTIHQLQIGDSVQIRDPDSSYFSQVLPIVSVGMIRVTVETPNGAASFLKRDLRFQRP
jgi:hypothetical protein